MISDDVVVWHYEKSGLFTVRSVYHMGMNYMTRASVVGDYSSSLLGPSKSIETEFPQAETGWMETVS